MSPEVKAIFDKLLHHLESDAAQNERLPEPFRSEVNNGISCDALPGGTGEFGMNPTNPIPVNGPTGEVLYLSRLRTDPGLKGLWSAGQPVMFHRLRSEDGPIGAVDVYEILSLDRRVRKTLYLSMYHPRKSRRAPRGFTLARKLDNDNFTYGVNHFVMGFPAKLDAHIRNWHMEKLGIPLPVQQVRKAVNGSPMTPSILTEAEERRPEDPIWQMREDSQKLYEASKDPRFSDSAVAMGADGIIRPSTATTEPRPAIFQTHNYKGDKPLAEWGKRRLVIVTIKTAHVLRNRLKRLNAPLAQGCWYECIYLAQFSLFVALLKTKFQGTPMEWMDAVASETLPSLIGVRFEGETFPTIGVAEAVKAYRGRHVEYFSMLGALAPDATTVEVDCLGQHLVHVFTGTHHGLLSVPLLSITTDVMTELATSVANLSAAMKEAGA